jgi:hypothetical protein
LAAHEAAFFVLKRKKISLINGSSIMINEGLDESANLLREGFANGCRKRATSMQLW